MDAIIDFLTPERDTTETNTNNNIQSSTETSIKENQETIETIDFLKTSESSVKNNENSGSNNQEENLEDDELDLSKRQEKPLSNSNDYLETFMDLVNKGLIDLENLPEDMTAQNLGRSFHCMKTERNVISWKHYGKSFS